MKLSGLLYLIVGAGVAIASWLLLKDGQKMILFLFTGIAMAIFGIIKLYLDREEPKSREEYHAELEKQLPGNRHHLEIPKICTICKARNHPRANFCGNCGNRL